MKRFKLVAAVVGVLCLLLGGILIGCSSGSSSSSASSSSSEAGSSASSSASSESSSTSSEATKAASQPDATGVRYVLVIGDDKWEKYDPHADMMCLLRIDLDNKVIHEVTVPRDTKYDFWGDYNKLNQMLTWVGVDAQVEAVSQVVGVPIDYYAKVKLDDFVTLVDNFGGIEAFLPYAITYNFYTKDFADESYDAGQQWLNGWRAMALSRARTGYGNAGHANEDMIRQFVDRQMLTTLMGYAYRGGVEGAIAKTSELSNLVETNIPPADLAAWLKALGANGSFDVIGTTGPFVGGIDDTADGLWLVYSDPDGWTNLMNVVKAGGTADEVYAATQTYAYPYFTDETPAVVETNVQVG